VNKIRIASIAFASLVALSCAGRVGAAEPLSQKVGERVTEGVLDKTLETLDKPENHERIGRLIGSPAMQGAMHDLTASIVAGVFDGIVKAQREGKLALPKDMGKSISKSIDDNVTPAMGRMTYRVVDSALSASLSDKHIAQVEAMGEHGVHGALRGAAAALEQDLGPALAATLDKDIGPAIATMISRDVMPAVGRGLDSPEMQAAIAHTAATVAGQFIAGSDDAMDTIRAENDATGETSNFQIFGTNVAIGYAVTLFVAFALGTLLIVLTVMLVRSSRRQKRTEEESARREQILTSIVDSLETDDGDGGGPELATDVRRLLREHIHHTTNAGNVGT
jgi:hypothetical protein